MIRPIGYYGFKIKYITRRFFHSMKKPQSFGGFIIIWILTVLWILWYNLYTRIHSADYLINRVNYTKDSISVYNNSWLYNFIALFYICKYYFDINVFGMQGWYEKQIKAQYPFIDNIVINGFNNNILLLDIKFKKPSLRFLYNNKIYWAYTDHKLIEISKEDGLWSDTPLVLLPIYLNESSPSIDGLLYNVDIDKMLYDLTLLSTMPLSWSITYIPWGDKYIFRNNDIRIYFNAKKNINQQLITLFTLMSQYRWFSKFKQIDIGSLDNPIVK